MTEPKKDAPRETDAWSEAARLIARWLDRRPRVDELLDGLPPSMSAASRARCQNLVFGVIRHFGRLDAAVGRLVPHAPRFITRAVVLTAGYELLALGEDAAKAGKDAGGQVALIVHHAVDQARKLASPAEARLVNAVVRKLAGVLVDAVPPPKLAPAEVLAEHFSHPEWLVRRWLANFGAGPTRSLLEWNQSPASVLVRVRPGEASAGLPDWLETTAWPDWRRIPSGHWREVEPLMKAGRLLVQDPATRIAVDLLGPQRGESILDVCAAPGGKSVMIADRFRLPDDIGVAKPAKGFVSAGRLVAMDLPGPRIERLKENLSRTTGVDVALVQGDLLRGASRLLEEHNLPKAYPAVLLDLPCTNTGVMRHRVDVKWRLQEGDFRKHARQQGAMLRAAARLVAPGGRLVYSTCSLDKEENEDVIKSFLADAKGNFTLKTSVAAVPWVDGHDGAAAFLLIKS